MIPRSVTLDTNILPIDDLRDTAARLGIEMVVTTVTVHELCDDDERASGLGRAPEAFVLGESRLGAAVLPSEERGDRLERILAIIGNGSFPGIGQRGHLTRGQQRQLRDAMAFDAHVASGRNAFVTNDLRAFVNHGRRDRLQGLGNTLILSRDEFEARLGGTAHGTQARQTPERGADAPVSGWRPPCRFRRSESDAMGSPSDVRGNPMSGRGVCTVGAVGAWLWSIDVVIVGSRRYSVPTAVLVRLLEEPGR